MPPPPKMVKHWRRIAVRPAEEPIDQCYIFWTFFWDRFVWKKSSFLALSLLCRGFGHRDPWKCLKVYLHGQRFMCRSVSLDAARHTVRISSNLFARCRATWSDTKLAVLVNRPLSRQIFEATLSFAAQYMFPYY
jgi:hypothetical protein